MNMDLTQIVIMMLQQSGVAGVVLIFWFLDAKRRDKQFQVMWADHQSLAKCVIEAVNNNTKALENLKGYVKAALNH